jgi:RNA polymerase sigma-70 factor (ECF subfamily)
MAELPDDLESSATLLARARDGDEDALDRLVRRCLPRLKRWAHGRLPRAARDIADTEDLVQDVVLKTLHRIDAFVPQHQEAFDAYLQRALWNRIRDEFRRRSRWPARESWTSDVASGAPSPLEEAIGREALDRYERAMKRLKPREREAVVSRLELGLSHAELAEALGTTSSDTARKICQRATARLVKLMDADD